MPALALEPTSLTLDLSANNGPSDAKVVAVPFPKKTVGIIFSQRTGTSSRQHLNTYLLDVNNTILEPQALWDAPDRNSRFSIIQSLPVNFAPDPHVLTVGPFNDDRKIVVYCSHLAHDGSYQQNDPKHDFHNFTIGSKNAIAFTMINSEDGGDTDYHDSVTGVAVSYTYK
ncbi:hypothetical protein WG66_013175 [Moniliophthora roreri]|nr:hypothetical protein WG66_013175 [Moniliophthora roreri]